MYRFLLFCSLVFFFNSVTFSKVVYVTVDVSSEGNTFQSAIQKGLVDAIGRVNGRSLESNQIFETLDVSLTDSKKNTTKSVEAYYERIKSQTRGAVKEYSVKNKRQSSEGLWLVNLSVVVAKYAVSRSANRKRIAVLPFQTPKLANFSVMGLEVPAEKVNRLFSQHLVNYLVQTRKFTVLDREYLEQVLGERSRITAVASPVRDLAKLGQELSADLVLTGSIEEFLLEENKRKSRTSDREIKKIKGLVSIHYRIIDVATGQIKFSASYSSDVGQSRPGGLRADAGTLSETTGHNIGQKILYAIYPIRIERVVGDRLILSQGGDTIKVNSIFNIFELSEAIKDSYTGEWLGSVETRVGRVKITRVTNRMSYGRLLEADVDFSSGFKPGTFIVRPTSTKVSAKTRKKIQKKIKEKFSHKSTDDFWD
jgi:hypothetical protein